MSIINSGGFTYEAAGTQTPLETYEWDNIWWEKCNTPDIPRVLHIGDSISCGLRYLLNPLAEEKILFDNFGTSKALDNQFFIPALKVYQSQQMHCNAVMFNNGLHGFHLDDETEYKDCYEKMILELKTLYPDIPLILLLTTFVSDEKENARVILRNKAVTVLAEKYNLPVIDMYSMAQENAEHLIDGVHFNNQGYENLACGIIKELNSILKK